MIGSEPVVSIVIPCYQQAHFLSEAIASVTAQSYSHHEVLVVDDGSRDDTARVAARYPNVRYIYQRNQGTAAARNTGVRESKGIYLVFLDADDRLLPGALEAGVTCLEARPETALVVGRSIFVADDGLFMWSQPLLPQLETYAGLLQTCSICHPAAAMCRRSVFDSLVGFNDSLEGCSDYDFYLRVARSWPIYCHDNLVSEYRQHAANKSLNNRKMLRSTLSILGSQRAFIKRNQMYEPAYRKGKAFFRQYYYQKVAEDLLASLRVGGNGNEAIKNIAVLLVNSPQVFSRAAGRELLYRLIKKSYGKLFKPAPIHRETL